MKTLKKISPIEFRLHTKKFVNDYSPQNYFEKLRLNVLFSRLLFWFFRRYGLYLYSYKVFLQNDCFLFHFYYYRTVHYNKYFKAIWWRKVARLRRRVKRRRKKLRRKYKKLWKFLTKRLFFKRRIFVKQDTKTTAQLHRQTYSTLQNKIKQPRFTRRSRTGFFVLQRQRLIYLKFRLKRLRLFKKRYKNRIAKKINFNFFFLYFFIHFFNSRSFILYKSLYRYLLKNSIFKTEHKYLLRRIGYLQQHDWAFDFIFIIHSAVNFANFDFILPFFVYQIKKSYKQRPFLNILFNVLKFLYYLKTNIYGIKILVHGPFDRHGRSRTILFRLGTVSITSYKGFILYDTIQWPTFYGAIQIKLWILYTVSSYRK